MKKKIPENPDFPDPDPDFRICFHGVANKAPRATCSQNFRPLAAVVPEIFRSLTIIKYRILFQCAEKIVPKSHYVREILCSVDHKGIEQNMHVLFKG